MGFETNFYAETDMAHPRGVPAILVYPAWEPLPVSPLRMRAAKEPGNYGIWLGNWTGLVLTLGISAAANPWIFFVALLAGICAAAVWTVRGLKIGTRAAAAVDSRA